MADLDKPVHLDGVRVRAFLPILILSTVAFCSLRVGLGRLLLWPTIQVCVLDDRLLQIAAPCLAVRIAGGLDRGYAVVRSPLDTSHVVVVPTVRIVGIESPELRRPGSPNYVADAWSSRALAYPPGLPAPPANEIGLAVNSQRGRTQDQFHVHVDCVRRDVAARLEASPRLSDGQWSQIRLDGGEPYAITSLAGGLDASNVVDLSARHLKLSQAEMPTLTLAVFARSAGSGAPTFLLVARQDKYKQHAELLLDHDCSDYRQRVQSERTK